MAQAPTVNRTWSSSPLVERMILDFTGCPTLQDVINLDLSKRKISTLDPSVFSKMSELETLNLSSNRVTGFPINLGLRKLKVLNLHHNHLKSVLTLEQFPSLEELNIENNLLSIADHYIAVYMLPKLKILNNKEVDIRETVQNMEDTLNAKVQEVWNENFLTQLKDSMSRAEIKSIEEGFIAMLNTQIQFGPDALIEFTNHMLTTLAEKHVQQQTGHLKKTMLLEQPPTTPNNKVQVLIQDENGQTIQQTLEFGNGDQLILQQEGDVPNTSTAVRAKKPLPPPEDDVYDFQPEEEEEPEPEVPAVHIQQPVEEPLQAAPPQSAPPPQTTPAPSQPVPKPTSPPKTSPQKPTPAPKVTSPAPKVTSPVSTTPAPKVVKTPQKSEAVHKAVDKATPSKRGRPKKGMTPTPKQEKPVKVKSEPPEKKEAPQVDDVQEVGVAYEPIHLLRCHSKEDDPNDVATNVWKCCFEPNPSQPGNSKWNVATCGSNIVCVIDCKTGIVLKKYQHNKDKEEFYCIAWTTLEMDVDGRKKMTNVLAAAGIKGTIKLLHPQQLLCYAEIKMERKSKHINCLTFHPMHPTWLICGSEDIVIWDIGIPEGPEFKCKHKKLMNLTAPGRVLGLVTVPSADFLLAGCDNGCYGWNIDTNAFSKRERNHSLEFLLPSKARLTSAINEEADDEEEKEGDMIDGLTLLKDDVIGSKVACDGSIHVWSLNDAKKKKPNKDKEVTISPMYSLEWCDSDSVYLDIGSWPGCGVLVSGDDQGEVWVYDVHKQAEKAAAGNKGPFKPNQLLPWPESRDEDEEPPSKKSKKKGKKNEAQEERIIVNDVSISSDCKYIVSVTNKNLVCIWQKA